MAGVYVPDALAFASFAITERTARSHEALENFRPMHGMQDHQPHPIEHPGMNAIHRFVANFVVRRVAPVKEHLRRRERVRAQALRRISECGRRHFEVACGPQRFRDRPVDPFRINRVNIRILPLVNKFVPDQYSHPCFPFPAARAAAANCAADCWSAGQSFPSRIALEISEEPTPTAGHPALKNSPIFSSVTPPVGTILRWGNGARIDLIYAVPSVSAGKSLMKSEPASNAVCASV